MEDNFRILSFRHTYGNIYSTYPSTGNDVYMVHPDASQHRREDFFKFPETYSIHSIKNLLTGAVITVNDYIYRDGKNYVYNISIGKDGKFRVKIGYSPESYGVNQTSIMASAIKVNKPVFTSVDDSEIFIGDRVYWVDRDTFDIYDWVVDRTVLGKNMVKSYFYSKGSAEYYVIMNKPILTLTRIERYLSKKDFDGLVEVAKMINWK